MRAVKLLVKETSNVVDAKGRTPLHLASEQGHTEVVKILIELTPIDVNSKESRTLETALHKGARNGHLEVVKALVNHGSANVRAGDSVGLTALHRAFERGHLDIFDFLDQ